MEGRRLYSLTYLSLASLFSLFSILCLPLTYPSTPPPTLSHPYLGGADIDGGGWVKAERDPFNVISS